ncbi:hypothetical protein AB0F36_14545 [Streptomyces sp. NPDC029080]|uniref:hypothetical protein n=1 Tax=Streptomyces sp. NPDC029080 TaxID=3155017 RepID=UPI0033EC20F2
MWVMHVERVQGDYCQPEIIDLEDGSGCIFRLHESDIHEDGPQYLSKLLTDQAQCWAPRPPGTPIGPVIPILWKRTTDTPDRFAIGVADSPRGIIYECHVDLISQRAADYLSKLDTERSPYWQRVPKGYHDSDTGAE